MLIEAPRLFCVVGQGNFPSLILIDLLVFVCFKLLDWVLISSRLFSPFLSSCCLCYVRKPEAVRHLSAAPIFFRGYRSCSRFTGLRCLCLNLLHLHLQSLPTTYLTLRTLLTLPYLDFLSRFIPLLIIRALAISVYSNSARHWLGTASPLFFAWFAGHFFSYSPPA